MNQASSRGRGEGDEGGSYRIKVLEGGIKKAKESERKMLESLVSQTKQLEQTKIELEEARLEIRNLQRSIGGSESSRVPSARNLLRSLLEKPPPPSAPARPEEEEVITRLKAELRLAIEAEEKSKKAMDGLALALKEVTEEANRAKDKLATAQSELRVASAEVDRLKSALEAKEDNLRTVLAEVDRLRLEAEECAAAWSAKEEGLIGCVKASDEEAARLLDSREEAREENARVRDIMKQALNEADVAMAGLEVARRENSQLESQLSEKDKSLETIRREYECLKASKEAAAAAGVAAAAAVQSARQPKCLPTSWRSRSARSLGSGSSGKPEDMFRSERWGNGITGPHIQNGAKAPEARTGSFRETGSADAAVAVAVALPLGKNSTQGTVGCVSNKRLNSLLGLGSCGAASFGRGQKVGGSTGSSEKQMRKQILRKFDELLRRKKSLRSYEKVATASPLAL